MSYTIVEAKLRAKQKLPYLARSIINLIPVAKPGIRTMAVDGSMRLYYDPAFLETNDLDTAAWAVLHEDLHLVFNHVRRFRAMVGETHAEEDRRDWNYAADFTVNDTLKECGLPEWPNCLHPEQFDLPANQLTEEYFHLLRKQPKDQQPKKGKGKGGASQGDGTPEPGCGSGGSCADGVQRPWEFAPAGKQDKGNSSETPNSSESPEDGEVPGISEAEQKIIERAVIQDIAEHQKKRGRVPGSLKRLVNDFLHPQVDPCREIWSACKWATSYTRGQGDFTYRKLPRRSAPGSMRLPASVRPIPRVTIIADTSGSMEQEDLALALGVIRQVLRGLPSQDGILVIAGDMRAQTVAKVFRHDQVEFKGGGGTDMGVLVVDAAERTPRPDAILVVTDGETGWPQRPVGAKVVACITRKDHHYPVPDWIKAVYLHGETE